LSIVAIELSVHWLNPALSSVNVQAAPVFQIAKYLLVWLPLCFWQSVGV
jgi:hypothetical protein